VHPLPRDGSDGIRSAGCLGRRSIENRIRQNRSTASAGSEGSFRARREILCDSGVTGPEKTTNHANRRESIFAWIRVDSRDS